MQNNDSEKFYDTYGKNASFEAEFPKETPSQIFNTEPETSKPSVLDTVKKYLALTLFIAFVGTMLLIGGVVVITILAVMLIGMLIRTLLFGPSKNSTFTIIKK
jgi:hypothetical protein